MKWLWHRLLAKLLELLLTEEGVAVLSDLPATSNPPQIDVLLLRRQGKRWTAASGRINVEPMMEKIAPLAEGPQIMDDLAAGRVDLIKAILEI